MSARPVTRSQRRSIFVGLGVLLVTALLALFAFQSANGLPGSTKTIVRARFASVGPQLLSGASVLINGDRVGRVTSINLDQGQSVVTMQLRGNYPLYRNASASVGDYTVLGQEVIELSPGVRSAGNLQERAIPASQTKSATDLESVFNVFTPATRQATQTVLGQVGNGAAGQGDDINRFLNSAPSTINDVGQISAAASSKQADLGSLLNAAEMLEQRFQGRSAELTTLLDQTNSTLNAVNVNSDKPLGQTLQALPATLQQARVALEALDQPLVDTQTAVADVAPGAAALGATTPSVPKRPPQRRRTARPGTWRGHGCQPRGRQADPGVHQRPTVGSPPRRGIRRRPDAAAGPLPLRP